MAFGDSFAETFSFGRPVAAAYRDAAGDVQEAAADVPRFDHDEAGRPLGLIVEPGTYPGAADRVATIDGDWAIAGPATVLHETEGEDGPIRSAWYTLGARAMVDGLLAAAGHHRIIGAVPGFLRNLGGHVRYREADWNLPVGLAPGDGMIFEDGADRLMIEG